MKTLHPLCGGTLLVLVFATGVAGQTTGWINFDNVDNHNPSPTASSGGLVFLLGPGGYLPLTEDINFELLARDDATYWTSVATWLICDGSAKGIAIGDGLFADPSGRSYQVPITGPGGTAVLEIRAWDGTATSYLEAELGPNWGSIGDTGPFLNPVGGIGSPPTIPADMTGMPAVLIPMPEPSSLALTGVGVGALLLLCRRRH